MWQAGRQKCKWKYREFTKIWEERRDNLANICKETGIITSMWLFIQNPVSLVGKALSLHLCVHRFYYLFTVHWLPSTTLCPIVASFQLVQGEILFSIKGGGIFFSIKTSIIYVCWVSSSRDKNRFCSVVRGYWPSQCGRHALRQIRSLDSRPKAARRKTQSPPDNHLLPLVTLSHQACQEIN